MIRFALRSATGDVKVRVSFAEVIPSSLIATATANLCTGDKYVDAGRPTCCVPVGVAIFSTFDTPLSDVTPVHNFTPANRPLTAIDLSSHARE